MGLHPQLTAPGPTGRRRRSTRLLLFGCPDGQRLLAVGLNPLPLLGRQLGGRLYCLLSRLLRYARCCHLLACTRLRSHLRRSSARTRCRLHRAGIARGGLRGSGGRLGGQRRRLGCRQDGLVLLLLLLLRTGGWHAAGSRR